MSTVRFVGTSYRIVLQVPRDAHHQVALALWRASDRPLIATKHVIGETWTFIRRRAGHHYALAFLNGLSASPRVTRVYVDEEIEREAWAWPRRHNERVYSFVDATSCPVMRQLGILEAPAFDGDFAAAGFVEVRP